MRPRVLLRICWLAAVLGLPEAAHADDKTACLSGIERLKAEAKPGSAAQHEGLQAAIDSAEQESFEGDWSECLQALQKGQSALRRPGAR